MYTFIYIIYVQYVRTYVYYVNKEPSVARMDKSLEKISFIKSLLKHITKFI